MGMGNACRVFSGRRGRGSRMILWEDLLLGGAWDAIPGLAGHAAASLWDDYQIQGKTLADSAGSPYYVCTPILADGSSARPSTGLSTAGARGGGGEGRGGPANRRDGLGSVVALVIHTGR